MALHLTPCQAPDGRQFESLYESLDPDNVLNSAALNKGYAADCIRNRLACDGIEPMIPPINNGLLPENWSRRYESRRRASAAQLSP